MSSRCVSLCVAVALLGGACTRPAPPEPSAAAAEAGANDAASDPEKRYAGKPKLILVENYVLDTINALRPEQQQQARTIVQHLVDAGSDWRAGVRQMEGWPPSIDAQILSDWRSYELAASESGHPERYGPAQFAMKFADEHTRP